MAEEDECSDSEVSCLMRVGRNSGWLRLFENTEVQFLLMFANCRTFELS